MAKRTENKKRVVKTVTALGPTVLIPVTPQLVVKLCEAKYECENVHYDSHVKDLVVALYDAIMESDEEPEQDEKPEEDGQAVLSCDAF